MDDVANLINFIQGFQEKPETISENKNDAKIFDNAMMYGVMAPLIVDQRWPEVSDDLKLKAKAYRMAKSLECVQQEMSTEFDALVHLHTASLVVPFDHHWYNIYFYLFKKYFTKQAEQLNIQVNELDGYEETLLKRLRTWIFSKQMDAIKQRIRGKVLFTGLFFYYSVEWSHLTCG